VSAQFADSPPPQKARLPERRRKTEAAVALRIAGASYEDIAAAVGYKNAATAMGAVERELGKTVTRADKERQRDLASRRLERLLRGVWGKAVDPNNVEHLAAARLAKDLIDRHARLFGLDAPTEVVVHNPTQSEIEAWVTHVLSLNETVLEADVIVGEVVVSDTEAWRELE
jgi:hypothetical protein